MSVRRLPMELVLGALALTVLMVAGCDQGTASLTGSTDGQSVTVSKVTTRVATKDEVGTLPSHAKQRLSAPPAVAVFGMIYIDASTGKERIFDGKLWVPHDKTVDSFYAAQNAAASDTKTTAKTAASMVQEDVCTDGDPACTPSGAHGGPGTTPAGHYAYGCAVCHKVGGVVSFAKNGPAFASGLPAPTYNTSTRTCSNVACHVVSGSFSYYSYNWGSDQYDLVTVTYGGLTPRPTSSWFSTGAAGCTACHDDPPRSGSTGSNTWHSGYHGNQGPTGERNQCQFCHPDASSPGNGIGDTITNKSLHANGVADVSATFTSACFDCH
ncbi:cytochrome C [Geomonas nitrogeniifigens]|uniref:cytochrome C n=1 Tax=Geomonas diazotrophica TaxID=2843197 RepID=UPI001C2BA561|nr:cytochrome C [Geomonas nitrogeniifigens]QXE85636.1 cytochrome C [Geomonas nitrogeniifigens]